MAENISNIVLVLGGISSGKSAFAETRISDLHENSAAAFYYFTPAAEPEDDEMREKVAVHRSRRPGWLETVECGTDAAEALAETEAGSIILFDSVGTLISRLMAEHPDAAAEAAENVIRSFCSNAVEKGTGIIFVSEETGMTLVALSESGRAFQKITGTVNQQIAALADEVYFVTAGIPQKLK